MARQRNYAAEYAARQSRLRGAGTSVYQQRNAAARNLGYRNLAQRSAARKSGIGLRAGDLVRSVSGADKRQVIPTPAGTIVRTTPSGRGRAVIESRIRNAGAGKQVTIVATVRLADGTRRDVTIFGRGGWSAAQVQAGIAYYGGLGAFVAAMVAELYGDGFDASDVDDGYDGFDSLSVTIS